MIDSFKAGYQKGLDDALEILKLNTGEE
jgi:hypothetical protein